MGKRNEPRNLCADILKIRWKDAGNRPCRDLASLEDISSKGACLQLEQPIPVGTMVSIIYPKGMYQGRVKYCVFQDTGHFVGIEFSPGYSWSPQDYSPKHMLRLRFRVDKNILPRATRGKKKA